MALPNDFNTLDVRVPVVGNPESVIFQFVNVRSPRMVVSSATAPGVVSYQQGSSSFVNGLLKVRNGKNADVTTHREQLETLTINHIQSAAFIAKKQALLPELSSLVRIGRWLRQKQASLTSTSVDQAIAEIGCKPASKERLNEIWEALIANTIAGGALNEREDFVAVLRAQYFLKNQGVTRGDTFALRHLASVEVVLPDKLFPPPQTQVTRKAGPGRPAEPEAADSQVERVKRLEAYETAIAELRYMAEMRLEEARNAPQPPARTQPDLQVPAPEDDMRVQAMIKTYRRMEFIDDPSVLSDETRKVVADIGSTEKLKIRFIIHQLEKRAAQLSREISQTSLAFQQVFEAGGALWTQPPAGSQQRNQDPVISIKSNIADGDLYDKFFPAERAMMIRPLGIADLNRVEQTLSCYKAGEVAHIENVLQGEFKERSTRRLQHTDQNRGTTTGKEETQLQDTSSDDRYELARETSNILNQNDDLTAGVSASTVFGPVQVEGSSNFITSSSPVESDLQTSSYAKNITDRALQRLTERFRDQRAGKLLEEHEENNKHGLDNRAGTKHMVGIYRWVDKIYQAQVVNYGKRLMFEFMIPEPGSFQLWAMSRSGSRPDGSLTLPPDPSTLSNPLKNHNDITAINYAGWAAAYGACVTPPPDNIRVARSFTPSKDQIKDVSDSQWTGSFDIDIPAGYTAELANVIVTVQDAYDFAPGVLFFIGNIASWVTSDKADKKNQIDFSYPLIPDMVEKVPFSFCVKYSDLFMCNVEVLCKPLPSTLEEWKIKTFSSIMQAYQAKKDAYDQAICKAQINHSQIPGASATLNQTIIFKELKKGCIQWLFDGQDFSNNALSGYGDLVNPPALNMQPPVLANLERAKFIEQCFEWSLMTYTLYPYFWAGKLENPGKSRWRYLHQLSDNDPLFLQFLQSGLARVHVSVRPGYEKAAMYFLRTGDIWNSGDMPGIDSPLYISILEELKSGTKPSLVGEPWEIRVPSTLTILQAEAGIIDGKGLPANS